MKKVQKCFLAAMVLLLGTSGISQAQMPGTIDSTFATNGVLKLSPYQAGTDIANAVAVLPDNKILMAGITDPGNFLWDAVVYRVNSNGTVDSTFGINGSSIFDVGGNQDYVQDMKVLTDGSILVAGGAYDGLADVNFAAAKLNADGVVDSSFGINGRFVMSLYPEDGEDIANAVAVQPDGKIILAGSGYIPNVGTHLAMLRLNENGTLDSTFGDNGMVITNSGYENDVAYDILILSDGHILLCGYADALAQQVLIEKFSETGALDSSFGTGGIALYDLNPGNDVAWAIRMHPNGKIMAAGRKGAGNGKTDYMVMAINANGTLDTGFGIGGVASKNININDAALDMLIEPSGKIVLAGSSGGGLLGSQDFSICRFNENGSVDNTFGTNGATVSEIGTFFSEAAAIGRQSDGKLVVAGKSADFDNDIALVRYFSDPVVATCDMPVNLVTSGITSNSAMLSWEQASGAASFQLRYRSMNDQTWTKMYVNGNSVTINGLTPGVKYIWSVKAKCDDGVSSFSTNAKFKTLPQKLVTSALTGDQGLQVYPNPSNGTFQFTYRSIDPTISDANIQIINSFGQIVYDQTAAIEAGELNGQINLTGKLATGNYFLTLMVGGKILQSNFIVQP